MSNFLGASLTIGVVFIALILSEGLAKLDKISKENARKLIHISVGNVVFFIPLFNSKYIAAAIPFVFIFGNYLLSPKSPIKQMQLATFKAGHSWGTVLYPISLTFVVFFGFDTPWLIVASFLPLVYGDGFAAVFGPRADQGKFTLYSGEKTLIGTSVISFFSWLTVLPGIYLMTNDIHFSILIASFVTILAPLIEILSPKGYDNIFLPVLMFFIFRYLSSISALSTEFIDIRLYTIGIIFGLIFAIGGYLSKSLTSDGAITGFLITTFMLGLGGFVIGVQLLLFFVIGSLSTKLVKKIESTKQQEFEKGDEQRDSLQAIAKTGLPAVFTLLLLMDQNIVWLYFISGVMTSALVDTLSTEIGIAFGKNPVSILKPWEKADIGDTGVISLIGTLGGLFSGAIFVGIIYVTTLIDPFYQFESLNPSFILITIIAGFFGMVFDSMLGQTIQRHNKCVECGEIVEARTHHDKKTVYTKGISWFNNDLNNFVGTTLGGFVSVLLFWIS